MLMVSFHLLMGSLCHVSSFFHTQYTLLTLLMRPSSLTSTEPEPPETPQAVNPGELEDFGGTALGMDEDGLTGHLRCRVPCWLDTSGYDLVYFDPHPYFEAASIWKAFSLPMKNSCCGERKQASISLKQQEQHYHYITD